MAAPTAPTATTICTEALTRKLNGGTPSAGEITRAENYGLEKVKRDMMIVSKKWKPLIKTAYDVITPMNPKYPLPADFESVLGITLITGDHTGTLSAVYSATSVMLAADEDATEDEVEGGFLLITLGTGVDQCVQIQAWNETTKIATLTEAFTVTPIVGDSYMLITEMDKLDNVPVNFYVEKNAIDKGTPNSYTIVADPTYGYILVYPAPKDAAGLRILYFADLRMVDLTSVQYSTILRRWAHVFEQGVYVWSLGEDDDRYEREDAKYWKMLREVRARDGYLQDESDLQRRMVE